MFFIALFLPTAPCFVDDMKKKRDHPVLPFAAPLLLVFTLDNEFTHIAGTPAELAAHIGHWASAQLMSDGQRGDELRERVSADLGEPIARVPAGVGRSRLPDRVV
jgi:hypothetical protein